MGADLLARGRYFFLISIKQSLVSRLAPKGIRTRLATLTEPYEAIRVYKTLSIFVAINTNQAAFVAFLVPIWGQFKITC